MNDLPMPIAELLALADAATQDVIDNQSCDCPIYAPGECAVCKAQAYRAARVLSPETAEETLLVAEFNAWIEYWWHGKGTQKENETLLNSIQTREDRMNYARRLTEKRKNDGIHTNGEGAASRVP